MQQMGQDVKKAPELAEAMREEVVRLNDQLKIADQRSEERLRQLSQQVAEQEAVTKQAVRDLAERQHSRSRMPPRSPRPTSRLPLPQRPPRDARIRS